MEVAQALDASSADALIRPYGGELVQAYVPAEQRESVLESLHRAPHIEVAEDEFQDIEMLGSGAYSPLAGFMGAEAWASVCADGVLPDGLAWGLPVTLAVTPGDARSLRLGEQVALRHRGEVAALLRVAEIFPWDLTLARCAFEAGDRHPLLAERLRAGKTLLVAGGVTLLTGRNRSFLEHHHLWPRETRSLFQERGWRRVAAVHLQNPWQRAHEYLLKCALESSDGLLLHAPIEDYSLAEGIQPAALSVASRLLLTEFFRDDHVVINPLPRRVFGHGARGALQHAIVAQNAGCDSLYLLPPSGEAPAEFRQRMNAVFGRAAWRGLGVHPACLAPAFHCERCGGIASDKSCPHEPSARIVVSENEIAETLRRGEQLPLMVTRPEIARALARSVADAVTPAPDPEARHLYPHIGEISPTLRQTLIGHKPAVLWMTGLSGAGKSTIAHRLERALLLSDHRVAVLDGDTLRNGLSRDLGFSDEARGENLRRAGEVAKILMDTGLIVIASFISPFSAERQMVRSLFAERFFEIYVEATLDVCEARDPKGLYRRARAGQIPRFTGVSSPYEPPQAPDLRLDTTEASVDQCVERLFAFLSAANVLRTDRSLHRHGPVPWPSIHHKSSLQ